MKGTVKECRRLGYTEEQAKLMGDLDDLFEQAVKCGLVCEDDAVVVGQVVGTMALKHTGKQDLLNSGVVVRVMVNDRQVV